MKKVFFIIGLVLGVSLAVVAIGYFLYSQIEYVDLIEKTVTISEEDDALLVVNEQEEVLFSYSIESWREQVRGRWDNLFGEVMVVNGVEVSPDAFTRFTAVSPFPEGVKTLVFSTSTHAMPNDFSLFWTLNIGTKDLKFLGEKNDGIVGNIIWSPNETHFAYFLNTEKDPGEYLTVDNIGTRTKEFTISAKEIIEELGAEEGDDFSPGFRTLRWGEDGLRLFFTTDTLKEEEFAMWSIDLMGGDLKREE